MGMNVGLQKRILKKVIEKNCRERRLPQENIDEILESAWEDHIDDEMELPENIGNLYERGILKKVISPYDLEEEKKERLGELKYKLIESIAHPYYHCQVDGCNFQTILKDDMAKHFQEKHELDDSRIPPINPYDMDYIILDELVNIALDKEHKNKKNFTISNQHLWMKLIKKLGYDEHDTTAPSNQKPRQILEKLGLLGKHKYQRKNKLGYNKHSQRVYHLNVQQLKDAIYESEFDDLKDKLD